MSSSVRMLDDRTTTFVLSCLFLCIGDVRKGGKRERGRRGRREEGEGMGEEIGKDKRRETVLPHQRSHSGNLENWQD